jgi:hypothetical protein
MRVSSKFNRHIPKDIVGNMEWRARVHARVAEEPGFAKVILDACSKDPLFFINGFGWTYDPRREPFPRVPFILYPFQEEAIMELVRSVNSHDILTEKSRDMGASWICICAVFWPWLFRKDLSFLLVSRKEEYVDQSGNPKSMFWKIDYLLDNMPSWLRPAGYNRREHRRAMHIENPDNGSVIDGESTNIDVARGDRRTAIVLDEFAAVQQGNSVLRATRDATRCRMFNSTPAGTGNAFYKMREKMVKSNGKILRLHWSSHPLKSVGLYTSEDGKLKTINQEGYPDGYEPILDGKLRSPWYDNECERCASPQEIAQELDIDYLGSAFQFFSPDRINQRIEEFCRPPLLVGDLDYDDLTGEPTGFREDPEGSLKLWFTLDKDGNPPAELRLVLGTDVSAGTGASNSAIEGWDQVTLEKALEFVNPYIRPEQLAKQAYAIGMWFQQKAYQIWESGGPGRQFGARLVEMRYPHYYLRRRDESLSKKVSDIPGVAQTKEVKTQILSTYRTAVERGHAVNRSREAMEECLEYIFDQAGGPVHSRSSDRDDPSGAKANHGDRAMADALAWKGIFERIRKPKPKGKSERASSGPKPYGSLAWRNEMREKMKNLGTPGRELDKSWR